MAEGESALYSNIMTLNQFLNKLLKFLPTNQTLDAWRLPPIIPLAWQMVEGSPKPAVHLLFANEEEVTTFVVSVDHSSKLRCLFCRAQPYRFTYLRVHAGHVYDIFIVV